jgi:hypothetical protein
MRHSQWKAASTDADFEPYVTGLPATSVALFRRFIELARICGPVTFELQRGMVVLCGTRRIFASVRPTSTGLSGHVNLARRLADRRVGKVEPLTSRLFMQRYVVTAMSDLDEQFGQWLCEARTIGDGAHLTF